MHKVNFREKLLCAFCYMGAFFSIIAWFPLLWLIISNLRKVYIKEFVRYHCYQAILFNMLAYFLPDLFNLLTSFLSNLLSLMVVFDGTIAMIGSLKAWILATYHLFIQFVSAYAIIWTLRGKYTYLPPISQAVNSILR
jgi:hypothetical protein